MAAPETGPKWRRVRRGLRSGRVWLFWGAAFYLGLVISQLVPEFGWLGAILAIPITALGVWLLLMARAALAFAAPVLAPIVMRLWPPASITPPPQLAKADEGFMKPPAPIYPLTALARGQCGWVVLEMRIDNKGLIDSYRIADQSPGGQFGRAVAMSLAAATVFPGWSREASTLITFVLPGEAAPDWARTRLKAANTVPWGR